MVHNYINLPTNLKKNFVTSCDPVPLKGEKTVLNLRDISVIIFVVQGWAWRLPCVTWWRTVPASPRRTGSRASPGTPTFPPFPSPAYSPPLETTPAQVGSSPHSPSPASFLWWGQIQPVRLFRYRKGFYVPEACLMHHSLFISLLISKLFCTKGCMRGGGDGEPPSPSSHCFAAAV